MHTAQHWHIKAIYKSGRNDWIRAYGSLDTAALPAPFSSLEAAETCRADRAPHYKDVKLRVVECVDERCAVKP